MLLISHADDFGLHPEIDAGIVQAAASHLVHETTMVVNQATPPGLLHRLPTKNFTLGIHINLTEGQPLSPPSRVARLLNRDGRFFPWPQLAVRLSTGRIPLAQIELELRAQFEQFKDWTGTYPAHLDSHHHIHCHPKLAPLVMRLADEYQIATIRFARRLHFIQLRDARSAMINQAMRSGYRAARSSQPCLDGLVDPRWLPKLTLGDSLELLSRSGAYELVWHLAIGATFPWRTEQQTQIMNPAWWGTLPDNVQLGRYADFLDQE